MSEPDDEGSFPIPVYAAVTIGLVVGWLCCCCISTKGCTDLSYKHHPRELTNEHDQRVWGRENVTSSDRRLALQLHAQEREGQLAFNSPEEQEAAERDRERRVQLRTEFVKSHLQSFPYDEGTSMNSKTIDGDDNKSKVKDGTPLTPVATTEESNCCCICLDKFQPGVGIAKSTVPDGSCQHYFHVDCIVPWLVRKSKCPFCREIFLEEDWKRQQAAALESLTSVTNAAPVEGPCPEHPTIESAAITNPIPQHENSSNEEGGAETSSPVAADMSEENNDVEAQQLEEGDGDIEVQRQVEDNDVEAPRPEEDNDIEAQRQENKEK